MRRSFGNAISSGLFLALLTAASSMAAQTPRVYHLQGDYPFAHDPSIAKDGRTYYVFATGKAKGGGQLPVRCSDDLEHWHLCGQVFDAIPQWIQEKSPGTTELWAPDVTFEHGEYRLYYAYSLFGKNASGIGLATNKTLDSRSPGYRWVDHGLVLESKSDDDFNAIDPNYIEDAQHQAWLSFGSFWGGIKMRALDPKTGMLSTSNTRLYSLAARSKPEHLAPQKSDPEHPTLPPEWQAIEAPFIFAHEDYYYLFVSWDLCCRGIKSSYRTMVGRSKSVTGPYVDETGQLMLQGGGTLLLGANKRWLGPGGESVMHLDDGSDLIVFHAYDATTGRPALQISSLVWNNGWPFTALGEE